MRYGYFFLSALLISGCESDNENELQEEDFRSVVDYAHASIVLLRVYPLMRALQADDATWETMV